MAKKLNKDSVTSDVAATENKSLNLVHAHAKLQAMRESGWKPVHKNPVERAKESPNSTKAAIKAFCWICVGADADPGAKLRVRDCSVGEKCPLFAHRPWQNIKGRLELDSDGVMVPVDSDDTAD